MFSLAAPTLAIHCRIGSSEIESDETRHFTRIHCRIGSSEIEVSDDPVAHLIHCRIGSSETTRPTRHDPSLDSLPDRQLRKAQVWKIFHTWITKKPAMQPGRSLESVPRACQVLSGFGAPARMGDGFARKDPRLSIWRFVIENSEPKC